MTHDLTPTDQIFCLILPSISEPNLEDHCKQQVLHEVPLPPGVYYRGADKSSARPGRKQATATKLSFASHPKKKIQNVRPNRSPRQQWPPRRTKNGDLSIVFESSRAKDFSASLYCHRVSTQLQLNIYIISYIISYHNRRKVNFRMKKQSTVVGLQEQLWQTDIYDQQSVHPGQKYVRRLRSSGMAGNIVGALYHKL